MEEEEINLDNLKQLSSIDLSEESERLGVDIVDMVNRKFWDLLLKLEDDEK